MKPITIGGFHFYQGAEKWLVRGVTYGPFVQDGDGFRYPSQDRVRSDMEAIAAAGANTIRLYDIPPESLALAAAENGLRLLIDLPWAKHVDVYSDDNLRQQSMQMIEDSVRLVHNWPNVMGVLLGNEISAEIVRWNGAHKVEKCLREMYKCCKSVAPNLNVGYANFPSTEYLKLEFCDFVGFNVYLDQPRVFRSYMIRLRHLYPSRPVLLTECGFDSSTARETAISNLVQNLKSAYEAGLSGAVVFAWTDEWHTGGYDITQWAFGLVDRDRTPKPALAAVAEVFRTAPQGNRTPEKISVVVATYNGARTLRECLQSLGQLNYPDFEIIVVDDGSTDSTPAILGEFPDVRVITQENRGLSAARNAGIEAAKGEIIAFTDSDCIVDPHWLYHLAIDMRRFAVDGIGGPNLTPPSDGLVSRIIDLAPGHATHVLLTESEAEHVPGCNMAFYKYALKMVDGFDKVFRTAGDDVDVIWRIQDAGLKIGFSTAGFVWHHRRPTMRGYLRQQRGYGQADALLLRKHPKRFNERGQSLWRGVIYPNREVRPLLGRPAVRYGVFGTGGYQCVYEGSAGTWPFLVTSLEWWLGCILLLICGLWVPFAFVLGTAGVCVSVAVTALRAYQNFKPNAGSLTGAALPLVWLLWLLQPIVRGASRYFYWFTSMRYHGLLPRFSSAQAHEKWPTVLEYWSEQGLWRVWVIDEIVRRMNDRRWPLSQNDEWQPWDLSVPLSWWFKLRFTTAEENHGADRRLLRMRYQLVPTNLAVIATVICLSLASIVALHNGIWGRWILVGSLVLNWLAYRNAHVGRSNFQLLVDEVMREHAGYIAIQKKTSSIFANQMQASAQATNPANALP